MGKQDINLSGKGVEHHRITPSLYLDWRELHEWAKIISHDTVFLPEHLVGNPAVIMLVVQKGFEIGIERVDALSSIIPMKGYMCMLGDKAQQLIVDSGLSSQWVTSEKGSVKDGDYEFTVKAHRTDTDVSSQQTFGILQMKRARLLVTDKMFEDIGEKGLSRSQLIRYKYPERSIQFIARGWLARDLFGDVLKGLRYFEEVRNYESYQTVIEKVGGIESEPMKLVAKSKRHTDKLLSTMEMAGELDKDEDGRLKLIAEHPDNIRAVDQEALFAPGGRILEKEKYTEDEIYSLKGSRAKHLGAILTMRGIHLDFLPKCSADQKRQMILEHQMGWVEFKKYVGKEFGKAVSLDYDDKMKLLEVDAKKIHTPVSEVHHDPANRYNIKVPPLDKTTNERTLDEALDLKQEIKNMIIEDEAEFMGLVGGQYKDMLDFCRMAPVEMVNGWINDRPG